jgi:1-deoxy-D-xylulose-5-phosphate reductoisomerase
MKNESKKIKRIAILGSTGAIGTQALDVISKHRDLYEVSVLTANNNVALLAQQARTFLPDTVVIANESRWEELKEYLADLPVKVFAGADSLCDAVENPQVDMVLTAMVGYSGLRPTVHAIRAGKTIALANKETLVVGGRTDSRSRHALSGTHHTRRLGTFGHLPMSRWRDRQRLREDTAHRLGGPFRTFSKQQLEHVTKEQALKPSQLEDGGEGDHRLGIDDEQGLRDDGGAMAVRCEARADRGTRPSAVHRTFHGAVP